MEHIYIIHQKHNLVNLIPQLDVMIVGIHVQPQINLSAVTKFIHRIYFTLEYKYH